MPYGDQRRLEIARALATDPQLILLDEPTAGMNPKETEEAMDLIFKIRDMGMAVVVIEHDMRFIFNLCDRVLCLVRGETLVEGTPGEVQSIHRVIEAYIGGDELEEEERRTRRERDAGGQGPRVCLRQDQGRQGHQLQRRQGEVVCLIGTNGAGKTTTLRTISGLLRPASGGRSRSRASDLTAVPAHEIVTLGLAHSPEGRRIFPRLTVEENLLLGAFARKDKRDLQSDLQAAYELFPILEERGPARRDVLRWRAADARHGPAMMSRPSCSCWTSRRWVCHRS
jgi:ABC-type branched-subunit amino acid transport system ATPase component